MSSTNTVFAIYENLERVDQSVADLKANGFAGDHITVLHPNNADTREFAARNHTRVPPGIEHGRYADFPLDGTIGVFDRGPFQGALHDALIEMKVPSEWCDKRVVHGKFLISVQCKSGDDFFRAIGVLRFNEPVDMSWSVSPEEFRAKAQKA